MDQTISLETTISFLVTTPIFNGLDPAERAEVVRIMEVQQLTDGEVVFHEGDPGDGWYVIFEGKARVLKEINGRLQDVAVLDCAACFGEMAIIDGEPRSATIQAEGALTVFRFRRSSFDRLLEQGSLGAYRLVLGMARMLSLRHRQLTQDLASTRLAQYQISE
jgi:CRP/FNR family cyclic AMP-dependent transcriptional regulator